MDIFLTVLNIIACAIAATVGIRLWQEYRRDKDED